MMHLNHCLSILARTQDDASNAITKIQELTVPLHNLVLQDKGSSPKHWILCIGGILLSVLIAKILKHTLFARLRAAAELSETALDDKLIHALEKTVGFAVVVLGGYLSITQFLSLESLNIAFLGNPLQSWGFCFLGILSTMVIGKLINRILLAWLMNLAKKTKFEFDDVLLATMEKPIHAIILIVGIKLSITLPLSLRESVSVFIDRSLVSVLWAVLGYLAYKAIDPLEVYLQKLASKTNTTLDDQLIPLVRKSLRVFIVIIFGITLVDAMGGDVKVLLTSVGIGGLAFALAAQDSVANLFGSIIVFTDRPFRVGQRVLWEGKDGVVEEVGFRSTKVRTLTGHLVTIPNSKITNGVVENISERPTIRRILNIGVTYDTPVDKLERAVQIIKDVLDHTEGLEPDKKVFFREFGPHSLDIFAIYWQSKPDYWLFLETGESINFRIMKEFEKEGIEFAFPTQTIYLKQDAPHETA